jgi:vacuolar-type H+-ATPase subunit D/Vma8
MCTLSTTSHSPTRMNLTNTKQRLKGAQTGHSLLAKKRDALMTRFRAILRKVDEVNLCAGRTSTSCGRVVPETLD